jgi:hypothetical protein
VRDTRTVGGNRGFKGYGVFGKPLPARAWGNTNTHEERVARSRTLANQANHWKRRYEDLSQSRAA